MRARLSVDTAGSLPLKPPIAIPGSPVAMMMPEAPLEPPVAANHFSFHPFSRR